MKWPPPLIPVSGPTTVQGTSPTTPAPSAPVTLTQPTQAPPLSPTPSPDGSLNINYTVAVKGNDYNYIYN